MSREESPLSRPPRDVRRIAADVTPRAPRFSVGFNGSSIEVECECAELAEELRLRLGHLMVGGPAAENALLRLTLEEIESGWIEIRDSTGRGERGQLEYVVHCARRWAIER